MVKLIRGIRSSGIYKNVRSKFHSKWSQNIFHRANSLSRILIRTMYAKRGLRFDFSGTWMYFDSIYYLDHEIPQEDPMLRSILARVQPGDVFIDVGAYVGMYSIPVVRKYPGTVKAIAFEPSPDNFLLLQKHISINRSEGAISAFELACGNPSGFGSNAKAQFLARGVSSESKMFGDQTQKKEEERKDDVKEVGIVALDDFLINKGIVPTIIKIDTEGYELHVLKGCKNIMLQYKPTIFCEIHKSNWSMYTSSEEELWNLMEEVDYCLADVSGKENVDLPEYGHVVLIPR